MMVVASRVAPGLRNCLYATLALATVLLLVGCGLPEGEAQEGAAKGPVRSNVVFMVADDLDAAMLRDHPYAYPNIRALAEEGTTFNNAFVTDPICCPARVTLLRGQYAHNHQVLSNHPPLGGARRFRALGNESSTLATWLRNVGYRTAFFGKYMNDYAGTHVPPGWDEWHAISGNYLSNDLNENGRVVSYDPEENHLDDVIAEKAASYVERTSGGRSMSTEDRPFFMWMGTKAPHQPATPAPRHRNDFDEATLPEGPSFDEADVSDKPDWIRDNPRLDSGRSAYMKKLYLKRLQSMLAVDEMAGRLVEALRERGELDDTYIFFTSDNGFHLGEHRLGAGKWTPYEEDTRVPLIVRGPGVPTGEDRDHLVLNNDLAPTVTELSGAATPAYVDGRSLVPLLTDDPLPEGEWRSAFLMEAPAEFAGRSVSPFNKESSLMPSVSGDPLPEDWRVDSATKGNWRGRWGRPGFEALRTRMHLYVEYETGEKELYDLRDDPEQLNSVARKVKPELLRSLKERLGRLRACSGPDCRSTEGGN